MNHNPYIGDERVFDAAMSLAKLVKLHNKPILFDMPSYALLVVGIGVAEPSELLVRFLDQPIGLKTSEFQKIHEELQAASKVMQLDLPAFADALADAFTLVEVDEVCECVLTEVGRTDRITALGEATVWMVSAVPSEKSCLVLDL